MDHPLTCEPAVEKDVLHSEYAPILSGQLLVDLLSLDGRVVVVSGAAGGDGVDR